MLAVGIGLWPRRGAATIDLAAPALPAGVTLNRASAGTRINASGALASEAADAARFEYQPVTLAYRGLLIEEARTNQILASQDLTHASWSRLAVAAGNAGAVIETTAATTAHFTRTAGGFATTAGQTMTMSVVAGERAGSAKRYLSLYVAAGNASFGGGVLGAIFDLAAGTFVAVGAVNAGMTPRGGGRWLCWWSAVASASATSDFLGVRLVDPANAGNPTPSYTGDGTSGLDVTQVQVETGAGPSSRIATAGATATRAADVVRIDWGRLGIGDGPLPVRIGFDDGSEQRVTLTVASGSATLPVPLARSAVRRIERG